MMRRRDFVWLIGGVAAVQPLAVSAQQAARGASKRQWAASAATMTFGVLVLLGGAKGAADDEPIREQQTEVMFLNLGYLGGLLEARFYEPHSTTGDPRDEIRQAASLYGLDSVMMMSIAKVESNFNPRAGTG